MMRVTILTVAFNSEETIARTIESILSQTYENIEYIIVDGKSIDRTVEVAQTYKEQFEIEKGRVFRIISEPDRGMYDALNKGVRMATGEIIGSINADDWYEPNAVEMMVSNYEKDHYDVAWGSINVKKASGDMIKHAHIGKMWTTTGWCHPAMFAKKEILTEFPYACESMYDDFDFITRVYKARKKICTYDVVISNFSFGGMSTKKCWKDTRKRINIKYRIYRKHGMSRLYWFHCVGMEMAKYILG